MRLGILLCYLLHLTHCSTPTCSYFNQQPAEVLIKKNDQILSSNVGSNGVTSATYTITENESISISCKNAAALDFQYGVVTVLTCPTGGSSLVNLPVCVAKCTTVKSLSDAHTTFWLKKKGVDTDVSSVSLQANTHVSIKCAATYAQKFGVTNQDACEAWTKEKTCQKMCPLSDYDKSTTRLVSNRMVNGHLPMNYEVQVKCVDAAYELPASAKDTLKCEKPGVKLNISNCEATCTLPTAPVHTTYHSSKNKLRVGDTFTVTCQGNLKLPIGSSNTAECKGKQGFPKIPSCQGTCKVTASSANTVLNKQVNGLLAHGEAVQISCKNDNEKLPFPYATPYQLTCASGKDFEIPSCQGTCAIPATPTKAVIKPPTEKYLRILEPLTVECKPFYSYLDGKKSRDFNCNENKIVAINQQCYLEAELRHTGAGTNKVQLTAHIDPVIDTSSGVTVKLTPDNIPVITTVPNKATEIILPKYGMINVKVETTSESGKTITRQYSNIYPGPPSPTVKQLASTSSTIKISISKPALIDVKNLVNYTIKYSTKSLTTLQSEVTLTGLKPTDTTALSVNTVLKPEFGGVGSFSSSDVHTGTNPVDKVSYTALETSVTISWAAVTSASNYKIEFHSNTYNQATTTLTVPDLKTGTNYPLTISACRTVAGTCWYGDKTTSTITSGPKAPDLAQFTVTNTSDSVTISRKTGSKKRATPLPYVVFVNEKKHYLKADSGSITIQLQLSTTNDIRIAQQMGLAGYGVKTKLQTVVTADCNFIKLLNFKDADVFKYVASNQKLTAKCADKYHIQDRGVNKKEIQLLCKNKQYVYADAQQVIFTKTTMTCTNTGAVTDPKKPDNTKWYIVGGTVGFLVILIVIILIILRARRNSGSYDAKKFKENTKNGTSSPAAPEEPAVLKDSVYFNNGFDNDKLCGRGQSYRSKGATSYGSQELRMEIADSDSGITEDLDNTMFNPNVFSSMFEEDAVSTKSALV